MNLVDQIPVLILHVLKADVAQDTGVVEEDINTAEVLYSGVDNGLAVLDAVIVGDGLAAGGFNLVDDDVGSLAS